MGMPCVRSKGRKRLISDLGLSLMNAELTEASISLNADTKHDFKKRCQQQIAREKGWNSSVPVDSVAISDKTMNSYIQKGKFALRKGQVKNSGRSEAYLNIRNRRCVSICRK